MKPTDEQAQVLDLAADRGTLAVEALSGTGKTTTMMMLAAQEAKKGRDVRYLAFNKAAATDASQRIGSNGTAVTVHSAAIAQTPPALRNKLMGPRNDPQTVARVFDLPALNVKTEHRVHRLRPGYLSGVLVSTIRRFCQSADPQISTRHVPWIDALGDYDEEVRAQYAPAILAAAPKAWADLLSPSGILRFEHDHYLKAWQLSGPRIFSDVILFDEAQDASPVMNAIVAAQDHAQVVYVGDSFQEIYGWRGAQNAMAGIDADRTAWLTQSFRFGPEIAAAANLMLGKLRSPKQLIGAGPAGDVAPIPPGELPSAILFRTNAGAVDTAFRLFDDHRRPFIVGGMRDVVAFARAARDLQQGRETYHPDLSIFETWGEVLEYVSNDMLGAELEVSVKLIEEHGADRVIELGKWMDKSSEDDADVVLSTAHKSKGREWLHVRLAADFPEPREPSLLGPGWTPGPEEHRLLYVAATRAQDRLDPFSAYPWRFYEGSPETVYHRIAAAEEAS